MTIKWDEDDKGNAREAVEHAVWLLLSAKESPFVKWDTDQKVYTDIRLIEALLQYAEDKWEEEGDDA